MAEVGCGGGWMGRRQDGAGSRIGWRVKRRAGPGTGRGCSDFGHSACFRYVTLCQSFSRFSTIKTLTDPTLCARLHSSAAARRVSPDSPGSDGSGLHHQDYFHSRCVAGWASLDANQHYVAEYTDYVRLTQRVRRDQCENSRSVHWGGGRERLIRAKVSSSAAQRKQRTPHSAPIPEKYFSSTSFHLALETTDVIWQK